jgi:ethanolamine utilization protein EutN
MELARVIGTVVATARVAGLDGVRLLVVQPEAADGVAIGAPAVAICTLGAGIGERVWVVHGREGAAMLADPVGPEADRVEPVVPIDLAVVGLVDGVGA